MVREADVRSELVYYDVRSELYYDRSADMKETSENIGTTTDTST